LNCIRWGRREEKVLEQERVTTLFRALGDPRRLAIFQLLMQGTYCNCEIGEELGLAPNLISHHLKVLREAGLVEAERHPTDARWILYSLSREALAEARDLCGALLDPERIGTRVPASCRTAEGACACGKASVVRAVEAD
jgi:ArsR family transcriptional regulator